MNEINKPARNVPDAVWIEPVEAYPSTGSGRTVVVSQFSNGLPSTWLKTTLDQVANIEMGQSPESRFYNENGEGLPFFQGKAEFGERYPKIRKWCSNPNKVAAAGDILASIRAPVGPTNIAQTQSCIGRGLAAIRAEAPVNQLFLFYFFQHIESWLSEQGTGSTFAAISGQFPRRIEFVLAPAVEQIRIVEKLEELLSDLDAGAAELKSAQKKLSQYRQSLLKAAVEGKLTEQWRTAHQSPSPQPLSHQGRGAFAPLFYQEEDAFSPLSPGGTNRQDSRFARVAPEGCDAGMQSTIGAGEEGENGAQLLERILKERRARWEARQIAKFKEQGKTPPKGWQAKYPEPVQPDTTDLPGLPKGWVWATLSQIGWLDRGRSKHRPRNAPYLYGGPYPFVQTGDIRYADTFISCATSSYSAAGRSRSKQAMASQHSLHNYCRQHWQDRYPCYGSMFSRQRCWLLASE